MKYYHKIKNNIKLKNENKSDRNKDLISFKNLIKSKKKKILIFK